MPHPRIARYRYPESLTHVHIHHCPPRTPASRAASHASAHYDYPDPMPAPPLAIVWLLAAALVCVVAGAGALVAMWVVNR